MVICSSHNKSLNRTTWMIAFNDVLSVPTPATDWFIYKYILDAQPFAFNAIYDDRLRLLSLKEEILNQQPVLLPTP